jgi:hypothetical protein
MQPGFVLDLVSDFSPFGETTAQPLSKISKKYL